MIKLERQQNLFSNDDIVFFNENNFQDITINKKVIKEWQKKIIGHQSLILKNGYKKLNQSSLFKSQPKPIIESFNPLELSPLPLSFWRWPSSMHEGPAVYFVIDTLLNSKANIILYIGETLDAQQRWKGEHDCKNYLANYSETLQKVGLATSLSIRFWLDVPKNTKERRKLEQKLIKTWLPPFNKETRGIWSTPFTSQMT